MRHAASLVVLLALGGCQTMTATPTNSGSNTGHLAHSFTDVTRGTVTDEPGYTHVFHFREVFRDVSGVGVHLTQSRICYAVEDECVINDYDIVVPPYGTATMDADILSYDPAREAYTEVYQGRDNRGNPVTLSTNFRASNYRF